MNLILNFVISSILVIKTRVVNSYLEIQTKLAEFIKKYYTNTLIGGVLLFLSLGLLFFFIIIAVEYFLWLNSTGRFLLLVGFVLVELLLLYNYILTPLFYLFKIKKGISDKEASVLIGKHFAQVDDKLYNLLDLVDNKEQSELLLASIEQRSEDLKSVSFARAINFKENSKYLKYCAIPIVLFALIWLGGGVKDFFGSTNRIMNYDLAFEKPAPFHFRLLSNDLNVLSDKSYILEVEVVGDLRPEDVFINIDGRKLRLQENKNTYQYIFNPPFASTEFYFSANGIESQQYVLNVLNTPSIQDFELNLEYPNYTGMQSEKVKGTGNASFPEGTKVTWKINGKNTENITLFYADTSLMFVRNSNSFAVSKIIFSNLTYNISTSNENVRDYERLAYQFKVVKDAYPSIKVDQVLDTLNPNISYYTGEVSDDYAVNSLKLAYYPENEIDKLEYINLSEPKETYHQFYYTFPSGLDLVQGKEYSFYFEVTDNDNIHKGKTVKSQIFSTLFLDSLQLREKELEIQQSLIKNLDNSLTKFDEQKQELNKIKDNNREKNLLNYNDQVQIKDFLKKQQFQESLMKKFSKELNESLKKEQNDNKRSDLLKERLERQEMEAAKNEKLLEELNKIADKINKEELQKRLEELGKKQQNSQRSLEQLLELTKRYYVTEMASQLAKDLIKLGEEQEELAKKELGSDYDKEDQKKLNDEFNNLSEKLDQLRNDNQDLKKPLDLNIDKSKQESVQEDQEEALEEIDKNESNTNNAENAANTKRKQKSASDKMKKLGEELQQSSAGDGGASTIAEDAEMLRQILDNLLTFSFKQENLLENLENSDLNIAQFSNNIKKQQELRVLFEHVDDSLFALSLRRAELSEFVNEQISEIYYNTDKTLEKIAENQIYQGVSYQKYVINAANKLSDFLAEILDNMQESLQSGKGKGQGDSQGFQLPDIIKSQGALNKKLEGQGKGKSGKSGEESSGSKGEKGGQEGGEEGEKGENGKKGSGAQSGNKGSQGEQGGSGEQGKGDKSTQGGAGSNGSKSGLSEGELKEIYEIYKEQQLIRNRLEDQLENMINNDDKKLGQRLARQMENFENDLLENGITQQNINKMNNIQHQLLKLKNATLKQGKKSERESNTNNNSFNNPILSKPDQFNEFNRDTEILNRQALPLKQNFKSKVKDYFKNEG